MSEGSKTGRLVGIAILASLVLGFSIVLLHPGDLRSRVSFGTQVLDREGGLLRITLAADGAYRIWYPIEEFRPELINALILKEDRNFWHHPGVDFPALLRAAWNNATGQYRSGASTIPMQLARLLYKLDTGSIGGKLFQILQALRLSFYYSKEDLLELFLNVAPCGGNVEGFGTASRIFYGQHPRDLALMEELALIVLPQDPARRNPLNKATWGNIASARNMMAERWNQVFPAASGLADSGDAPLDFKPNLPFEAPHFVNWALKDADGATMLPTTLDPNLQSLVQRKVDQYVGRNRPLGVRNAVVLLVSEPGMEVLAHVGSAAFFDTDIDGQVDGTAARRSPGSTLKPFIYGLALDQGLIHPATMLKDTNTHFGFYNPDNYDNDFDGPVSAAEALRRSRNIPAVALAQQLNEPNLYELLISSGVDLPYPENHYGLSLVLGGAEMTMRELVALYGALAGDGTMGVLQTRKGLPSPARRRIVSHQAAWLIRRMLLGRSLPGTPEDRSLPIVAFKTGTSIGFRDSWSIGVFDGMVLAVWVGDFQGGSTTQFIGARTAAPLMSEIVEAIRSEGSVQKYRDLRTDTPPQGLVQVMVCPISGALAGEHCRLTALSWFIPGVSPITPCGVHRSFPIDRQTGLRRDRDLPGETRREVFEVWPDDILEVFAKAGIRRRLPPPLDSRDAGMQEVVPSSHLKIQTPVEGLTYLYNPSSETERVPLVCDADSQARQIFWFLNETFLGQAPRGEPFFWQPTPGNHQLKAVDDLGRTGEIEFYVRSGG